ncbi:MAG: serine protease [Acetobacteraceae bacterium]|nr:serine protease [Acetobacteraceae bacterium]
MAVFWGIGRGTVLQWLGKRLPLALRRLAAPLLACAMAAFPAAASLAPAAEVWAPSTAAPAPRAPAASLAVAVAEGDPIHAAVITPRLVGSAFKIAPGLAVTAAHVVEGVSPGSSVTLRRGPPGGPTVSGRLIGSSPRIDLAVLEVPLGFLPIVATHPIGRWDDAGGSLSRPPAEGTRLLASGSVPARDPLIAVPRRVPGAASGRSVDIPGLGPGFVATLPGAVPGFSGGPVVDTSGRLAGMVIAIRRLPAGGRHDGPLGRTALTDDVYVLSAEAVVAEARRIVEHAPSRRLTSR